MQEDKNAMRFPLKLWYLLNLRSDAIMWGGTGKTILMNYRVLQSYLQCDRSVFKTTNISSFVRQLNLYGFRKVTSHLQDPLCNSSNPYMHEYIHDYFQFGRPDLLNKINRKVLTVRRPGLQKSQPFYTNDISYVTEMPLNMTPLQKARHTLKIALCKAAQEIFIQNMPSYEYPNTKFVYNGDMADTCEEEEIFEVSDWIDPGNAVQENILPEPAIKENNNIEQTSENVSNDKYVLPGVSEESTFYREYSSQDQMDLNNMSSMPWQPNPEGFSNQFLSMPELGPEPADNSEVELLAEFDIDHDMDQGITRKTGDKSFNNSLNCVLPSINNDPIDTVSMVQEHSQNLKNCEQDQYMDREWDQMLDDMIINRETSSDIGSELKDLYSQISRTIDLLNP